MSDTILEGITQESFQQRLVGIGSVVSEKKPSIKIFLSETICSIRTKL
jgi:hypothetical protein